MFFRRRPQATSPDHVGAQFDRAPRLTTQSYRLLESRMVFDGAAADTAATAAQNSAPAPTPEAPAAEPAPAPQLTDVVQALAAAPVAPDHAGATIVFIDGKVGNPQDIQGAVPPGAEVVILDPTQDGVVQIAGALAGRTGIDAIHIVSHGGEGSLRLGTAVLDAVSMQGSYAGALATIGHALSHHGDILVYGCDFTRGADGMQAAQLLSTLTGADVAGSTDDTGSAALGGNWTLETHVGDVDAIAIDAPEWNGILAPLVISAQQGPAVSGGSGVGATGLWEDAGTIGSTSIDIRATVTSATSGATVAFNISGDNLWLLVTGGTVTVRWEIFASGTNQTIRAVGDPNFRIADIDGLNNTTAAWPQVEIEAVSPSLYGLTSYTLDNPTNLEAGVVGSNLMVRGTRDQNSESTSLVAFDWTNVSSWDVTYTAVVGQSTRWFFHDGDGDFTFTDPVNNYLLGIDLDANNSTSTGTSYRGSFAPGGGGVAIVDADATISQHAVLGTDLGSASVVLTNAQAGDQLLVGGSSATSGTIYGLSYTITNSGGQISVALSGTASVATYQSALQAITFDNSLGSPSVVDRTIDVSVTNDNFITTSNIAVATIRVNSPPTTTDPDPTAGTPYVDPGNSSNIIVPATDNVAVSIDLDLYFTDANGDPRSFSVGTLPSWLSYNSSTHVLSGTPPVDNVGSFPVNVTVSDGRGGTLAATVTFEPVNPGPTALDDTSSTGYLTPVIVPLMANDTDPDGDPLSVVSASVNPAKGSVAFDGTNWVFTPAATFSGDAVISYTIRDQDGATSSATHTVTVANAPPTTTDPDPTPGTPYIDPLNASNLVVPATDNVAVSLDLSQYFTDANGDPLSFAVGTLPSWLSYDAGTHVLSGTPPVDNVGSFPVGITVTDTRGGSLAATVTFAPVNPPPVAVDDTSSTAYLTPVIVPLTANDSDPDGDPISVVSATVDPAKGSVAFNGTDWVFTPAATFSGDAVISYTIRDQDGATASATHTVTVANAPPTTTDPDPTPGTPYVDPGNPNGIIVPARDNVLVAIDLDHYFTDPNGDTLSIAVGTLPSWLSYDPGTHVLSGTPPVDNVGTFPVGITVTDTRGGSLAATVTFDPVNPPPVAVDDTSSTAYLTPVIVPLTANDTDPDGDPLTVVSATVDPAKGSVAFNGTDWVFTPAATFSGDAVISYTISDQDGATSSATHTVTVANAPPTPIDPDPTPGTPYIDPANPNGIVVPATDNVPVSIDLSQYFTDANGDPLTYSVGTLPSWLSYDAGTHVLSGTPPVDNVGAFPVSVTVTDTRGGSLAATVTFDPVNPAPIARNDIASTAYMTAVELSLMANDSDPDGDPITVVSATVDPSMGRVAFDGRSWVFTPAPGFSGDAVISYTIRDQDGATASAVHTVSVAREIPYAPLPPAPQPLPETPRFDLPGEPVRTDGIVIETVRQVGSLNGISGRIGTNGIVIDTANGAGDLGSVLSLGGEVSVADAAPVRNPEQLGDHGINPRTDAAWHDGYGGHREPQGLTGFSLRMDLQQGLAGSSASSQVIVETLVREETLIIQISSRVAASAKQVVEYRVTSLDGGPLPGWLDHVGRDLIVGRRPADSESIALRISVKFADGSTEDKRVRIETVTGEIQAVGATGKVAQASEPRRETVLAAAE